MDVEKFRRQLLAKEQELLNTLGRTGESARERSTEGGADLVDQAVASDQREEAFSDADRDAQLLKDVREALQRMDQGTYGRCIVDGEMIEESRLEAVPWARYCLKHQQE